MIFCSLFSKEMLYRGLVASILFFLHCAIVHAHPQDEDEESRIKTLISQARQGIAVGPNTSIYPFITFENGFETYTHIVGVHHPAWNSQDRFLWHFKYEPVGDIYLKFKYLGNWFSDGKTRTGFSLKFSHTDDKFFYGLGNSTLRADREELALHSLELSAEIARAISDNVDIIWSPGYWRLATKLDESPADVEPWARGQYITSTFTITDKNGIDYLSDVFQLQWSLSVEHGLAVATPASSFTRFSMKTFERIPVFKQTKLGIRTRFEYLHAAEPERIPYFVIPEIGSRNGLRGFSKERFRNFAVASLNLEYAIPFTRELETFLLTDFAAAEDKPSELTTANSHQSFGIGFRLLNNEYPVSAGVAFGSEGWRTFSRISVRIR